MLLAPSHRSPPLSTGRPTVAPASGERSYRCAWQPRSRLDHAAVVAHRRRLGKLAPGPAGWGVERVWLTAASVIARAGALREHFGQHHGVVVLRVASAVEDRQRAGARPRDERLERVAPLGGEELGAVARAEGVPLRRIVAEPAAQAVRDGQLARPQVHVRLVFADAARPEPVDEHPVALIRARLVVDAADADRHAPLAPG